MTDRLLLLRHAKSSWDEPIADDRARPLAPRGRRAAARIGEHLRSAGLVPAVAVCSPAERARETLRRLELPGGETRFDERLYGAGAEEILAVVRDQGAPGTLLAVGHNPGMHELAIELAGPDLGEDAERLRERFPTGALAVFEIEGAWSELSAGRARLSSFVVPRELG
jgi:phosphohistidine phosphatase